MGKLVEWWCFAGFINLCNLQNALYNSEIMHAHFWPEPDHNSNRPSLLLTLMLLLVKWQIACSSAMRWYVQLSSQILDTMHYLQQPVNHRHHTHAAHQPTQSLHAGASVPFGNGSAGSSSLLGQHLRSAMHRSNAAAGAGAFTTGTAAHVSNDAFQPSLCEYSHLAALFTLCHTWFNPLKDIAVNDPKKWWILVGYL